MDVDGQSETDMVTHGYLKGEWCPKPGYTEFKPEQVFKHLKQWADSSHPYGMVGVHDASGSLSLERIAVAYSNVTFKDDVVYFDVRILDTAEGNILTHMLKFHSVLKFDYLVSAIGTVEDDGTRNIHTFRGMNIMPRLDN